MTTQTRFLHVANGSSTTNTIEAAGIRGLRSIWADPLYEGPVPGGLTDDELVEVRSRYLAGSDPQGEVDPVNDLRRWRQVIAADQAYDELVLWFEHDLFDQLNLVQLLSWIPRRIVERRVVSLICIGSFPGRPQFKGLGELSAAELAPLLATRRPVEDAQFALADTAWQAFREPTPERLQGLRQADTTALPYLAPAIDRFLQEYPSTSDGLSRSERRLLRLAADAPIRLGAAFPRMDDDDRAYHITDLSLAALAATLARTSPPLLAVQPAAAGGYPLHAVVSVTDGGRAALGGHLDRVTCGLDRWLGGVHLQSGGPMWRWDEERRRVRSVSA
jgi:hypothetical protein